MQIESTTDDLPGIFAWVVLGLILLGVLFSVIQAFLSSMVLGLFIYYCSRPIHKRMKKVVPYETISAVLTIFTFFTPFILIFYYTFSTALNEFQRAIFEYEIYELQPYINPYINFELLQVLETPEVLFEQTEGVDLLTGLLDYFIVLAGVIGDVLLIVIVSLTVAYYLLKDDDKIRQWLETQSEPVTKDFTEFANLTDEDLSSIYFGNILNAIFTATIGILVFVSFTTIAPKEMSLVFPVLLGILAGISSLVPMVGTKPVYFPVTVYLFATIWFQNLPNELYIYPLSFFIISAIIVDFIPDMLLRPYVSGRNIHIGILLIAYLSGPVLIGRYGFFLFPIFAVLFQHYYTLIFPKILRGISEHFTT